MSATRTLTLGTRGSPLALWQAHAVAAAIAQHGGPSCEIRVISTSGDRRHDVPLSAEGGKGLFVKEIEDALLAGEIDLAVHSAKDMSAVLPEGLTIAAALPREDPRDAVVLARALGDRVASFESLAAVLGPAPVIGTSSVRRTAQLRSRFQAARFVPVRGNLETRLRKLDEGGCSSLILAAAGLRRLGLGSRISMLLPIDACVPAPGQGIVAVEVRDDDALAREAVERTNDVPAGRALAAERALVAALGGGCQLPLGAIAIPADAHAPESLELAAIVASRDGRRMLRSSSHGPAGEPEALGERIAADLIARGALEMLAPDSGDRDAT